MPCLIFLDLKLPRLDGFEVLSWLRNQRAFPALPVVILTSSSEERDRKRAAELAANAYLTKPPDENMVRQVILSAEKVKFELAVLGSETPLQALGSKSCRLT